MEVHGISEGPTVGMESMEEVEKVFKRFDANGDGRISASELGKVVRAMRSDVTEEEVHVMIEEMDSDRDGFVSLNEFADFHRGGGGGGGNGAADGGGGGGGGRGDEELRDAFDMYDLDHNGVISAVELHMVLQRLGEKCSVHDCTRMIGSFDADGDGSVNYEEFKKMMTGEIKK